MIGSDNTAMPIGDLTTGKETRRLAPQDGSPAQVAFAPETGALAHVLVCLSPCFPVQVAFRLPSAFFLLPSARGYVQRITALAFLDR